MLHIHNGDSTADTARKSNIPGEHLAWREALVCGPAPADLSPEQFLQIRAKHLAEAYGVNLEQCEQELRAQTEALNRFSDHEEVVLWFEHDLFCQVHLIYLLDWFAQQELGRTRLSLVSIDEYPGFDCFRGLGELKAEQLSALFPERQEVTPAQLKLGVRAWQAYSSPDAAACIVLLNSDTSPLPFLKSALLNHVRRFPSIDNGVSSIGNAGLDLVAKGYCKFKSLFPAFIRREGEYGFGDAQLYLEMKRLADAPTPLLKSNHTNRATNDPVKIFFTSFEITKYGQAVLNRAADFVRTNGIDQWLGGVHLQGNEVGWRWDEQHQELLVRL